MPTSERSQVLALAIETSGRLGSVALSRGPDLLGSAVLSAERRHAVELVPKIDELCRSHRIEPSLIGEAYVSAGPGSFTGLRVGMTVARTLAWAASARVVRIPTLDVIAQNALKLPDPPQHLVVLLDAKRNNVYAACFERNGSKYLRRTDPQEVSVAKLAERLPDGCVAMGEGVAYHREAVDRAGLSFLPEELSRARAEVVQQLGYALATAGQFDTLHQLVPIYIRRPEAEEVWDARHADRD